MVLGFERRSHTAPCPLAWDFAIFKIEVLQKRHRDGVDYLSVPIAKEAVGNLKSFDKGVLFSGIDQALDESREGVDLKMKDEFSPKK
jgi:hypothetical protein